jgi:hypothetical protein
VRAGTVEPLAEGLPVPVVAVGREEQREPAVAQLAGQMVQKYQQKKVWSYWAYENLWGNFEWNPDPARKQNIMLTGFFALSLGAFQTVTGDLRHSQAGAIEFVWSEKRRYPYSYDSLCASLTSDYLKSPWGLVVCEPNWIFSACNMRGAAGLMIHDRVHGTHYWDMIKDGYYRGLEQEFVRPDGMLNFYRSARTGIGQNGASFSTDLRPMAPHLADRGLAGHDHQGHARGVGDRPPGRVGALPGRDGDPRGDGRQRARRRPAPHERRRPPSGGGVAAAAPGAEYGVIGGTAATLVAAARGRATVDVDLGGRHELRVVPVA